MNELFKIIMEADVGGFVKSMADADKASQRVVSTFQLLGNAGKSLGRAVQDGIKGMEDFARKVRNVGIAGTTMATGWAVIAASFETSMRNVNALLHLGNQQFDELSSSVLSLGASFPQGANDAAEGMYQIVSAGYEGTGAVDVLRASLTAATAGISDTATAADALIYSLKAYGKNASEAGDVSDILFQTVNKGIITFPQLAQGMGQWVNMASSAKVPLEQAASALAAMTLTGLDPAEAGTSLARMIQQIIDPSQALVLEVKKLGYESPLAMVQTLGLGSAIALLGQDTGGTAQAFIAMFNEIRAARGAMALASADGRNYNSVAGAIEDKTQRAGAAMAAYAEQQKGTANQFKMMVNAQKELAARMGEPLLGPVQKVMEWITNLTRALSELPHWMQTVGSYATALGSILLTVAGFVGVHYLKNLLLAGAMNYAARAFQYFGAQASVIPLVGGRVANGFALMAYSAENAKGSILRFGVGMSAGILRHVPIIGQSAARINAAITTIGMTALGLTASFFVYELMKNRLESLSKAAKETAEAFQAKLPFGNMREAGATLDMTYRKLEAARAQWDSESPWGNGFFGGAKNEIIGTFQEIASWTGLVDDKRMRHKKELEAEGKNYESVVAGMKELTSLGPRMSSAVYAELYNKGIKTNEQLRLTREQVIAFAAEKGIQLFDPKTKRLDEEAFTSVKLGLTDLIEKYGQLPDASGKSLDQQAADMQELSKYVDNYVQKVSDNFLKGADAVEQFDDKFFQERGAKRGEAPKPSMLPIKEFQTFYQQSMDDANRFINDYNKAVAMGINPSFLSRVLEAGPQAAGDILDVIVNDTTGKYAEIINNGEKMLAAFQAHAVAMARLTAKATSPGATDQLAADLPKAQAVTEIMLANPNITYKDLMEQSHLSRSDLEKVAAEYAITLPMHVKGVEDAKGEVQFNADELNNWVKQYFGQDALSMRIGTDWVKGFEKGLVTLPDAFDHVFRDAKGKKVFYGGGMFDLSDQFTFDPERIQNEIRDKLKIKFPTATKEEIEIGVKTIYKDALAKEIFVHGAFKKPEVKDFILSIVGDEQAHQKILNVQNQLKLTPSELYTFFGVTQDKEGQNQVIDWIAQVSGADASQIKVDFDENHVAHFYRTAEDAKNKVNEIDVSKAAPTIDPNTGQFDNKFALVNGQLVALGATTYSPTIDPDIGPLNAKIEAGKASLRNFMGWWNGIMSGAQYPSGYNPFTGQSPGPPKAQMGPGPGTQGSGGFVRFADGGFYSKAKNWPHMKKEYHTAQIAKPGTMRLWAEPETGGEAYIPLGQSKRAKSEHMLEQVAKMFGYKLEKFAEGGIQSPTQTIAEQQSIRGRQLYYGGALMGTASMNAAIAEATKGIDMAKDAQQWAEASLRAQGEVSKAYEEVERVAGHYAAQQLINSGLVGEAFDAAAQKIIADAKAAGSAWEDVITGMASHGDMSQSDYMKYLNNRLKDFTKYTQDWYRIKDRLSEVQYGQLDKENAMGNISSQKYLAILRWRAATTKKYSDEWYETQQKLFDIGKTFSQPFLEAGDAIKKFGNTAPQSFQEVKNFYTHVIKSSNEFLAGIATLKQQGAAAGFIEELQKEGPSALPLLKSILAGGPDAIKFINDSLGQINQIANASGALAMGDVTKGGTNFQFGDINFQVGLAGGTGQLTAAQVQQMINDGFAKLATYVSQKVG